MDPLISNLLLIPCSLRGGEPLIASYGVVLTSTYGLLVTVGELGTEGVVTADDTTMTGVGAGCLIFGLLNNEFGLIRLLLDFLLQPWSD